MWNYVVALWIGWGVGGHGSLCTRLTKAANVILYLYLNRSLNSFMTFGDKGKSTQITFIRKQYYSQQLALGFDCIGKMQGEGGGGDAARKVPYFGTQLSTPLVIWTTMTRPSALGRKRA